MPDEVARSHRLKSIAACNGYRGENRACGKLIDQKGGNKDGRRNPMAPQQNGCNGQPRRRPDGCGARINRREVQAKTGNREIRNSNKNQLNCVAPSWVVSWRLARVASHARGER